MSQMFKIALPDGSVREVPQGRQRAGQHLAMTGQLTPPRLERGGQRVGQQLVAVGQRSLGANPVTPTPRDDGVRVPEGALVGPPPAGRLTPQYGPYVGGVGPPGSPTRVSTSAQTPKSANGAAAGLTLGADMLRMAGTSLPHFTSLAGRAGVIRVLNFE